MKRLLDAGALDRLRSGVEAAIAAVGTGLLRHRSNGRLRVALQDERLDRQEYYRQLLRLVYRLVFLFVAEARDALPQPAASEQARERYLCFYSMRRLSRLAGCCHGEAGDDLWQDLRMVMEKLYEGCPRLALPGPGSFLWSPEACPWLMQSECAGEDLLDAIRSLCFARVGKKVGESGRGSAVVDWRTVGAEELGSVYEILLELDPRIDHEAGTFALHSAAAGHERKTTGSYYTPSLLVECVLDSALDPVLEEAVARPNPEEALLSLRICDPACGSGRFLLAAARRMANRLAQVRTDEEEPSSGEIRRALRDVVGRCLYGVDLNPMAVELCRLGLWMEAPKPGRPLSFPDAHIKCGNALLGVTPALMARGIPDDAFRPVEGDDREVATRLRLRNRQERKGRQTSDRAADGTHQEIDPRQPPNHLAENGQARFLADAWCAAFFWPKQRGEPEEAAITEELWRRMQQDVSAAPHATRREVRRLAKEHRFFHWHLAFPQVFRKGCDTASRESASGGEPAGWTGGFDCVLGNPPYGKPPSASQLGSSLLGYRFSKGWRLTNVASLFIAIAALACRDLGHLSFVLPKSLTYVEGYSKTRESLLRAGSLLSLIDVRRAFKSVGLEQIILSFRRGPAQDRPFSTWRLERGETTWISDVSSGLCQELQMWPIYLEERHQEVLRTIKAQSEPLHRLCTKIDGRVQIFRGVGFQSRSQYHAQPGDPSAVQLLGGRNITGFVVWSPEDEPYRLCKMDHPDLEHDRRMLRQLTTRIVCKNVVSSDVKVEATILRPDQLTLDTINNILIDPCCGTPLEYITAVLNSSLSSWYLRNVLFNQSGLTMHLDKHYLGSIPVPRWHDDCWQRKILALSEQLLRTEARKFRKGVTNITSVQGRSRARIDKLLIRGLGIPLELAYPFRGPWPPLNG